MKPFELRHGAPPPDAVQPFEGQSHPPFILIALGRSALNAIHPLSLILPCHERASSRWGKRSDGRRTRTEQMSVKETKGGMVRFHAIDFSPARMHFSRIRRQVHGIFF